ncbi:MAG: DUF3604 domain-containing protein, partial [Rhodospirillaceae bacterium]
MPLKHALSLALLFLVTACATHNSVSDSAALKSQPGVKSDGAPLVRYTEQRQVCLDRNPNRNAYFGDLHIHTGFSYDARPFGTEITPADAYHFAKGGPIATPPYNENGEPTGVLTLKRPLDFAAVTDHSEFFGELALCSDPSSSVYDTRTCWLLRQGEGRGLVPFFPMVISQKPERLEEIC